MLWRLIVLPAVSTAAQGARQTRPLGARCFPKATMRRFQLWLQRWVCLLHSPASASGHQPVHYSIFSPALQRVCSFSPLRHLLYPHLLCG
jgi:hypothetical protein